MDTETQYLTSGEALKLCRSMGTGTKFYILVRSDAHVKDDPTQVYTDVFSTGIQLTRRQAVETLKKMCSPSIERRGGRFKIQVLDYQTYDGRPTKNFWIM